MKYELPLPWRQDTDGTALAQDQAEVDPEAVQLHRSNNRFEIKYLIPHEDLPLILDECAAYLRPDPHCNDAWGYPVYSVYWDSADWAIFWEKVEGIKYRRKLRTRRYANSPGVFVEIKQRVDRTLQKRRTRLSARHVVAAFGLQTGEEALETDDPVLSEALYLRHVYRLEPRMAVAYTRRAYFSNYEADLRVTFDRRVQYLETHLDVVRPFEVGKYVIDPRLLIMEIKYADRVPLWLCRLVRRHQLQLVRLSKYCCAVDLAYFGHTVT